ncbi:beta-lactamase domain-containing protein [Streptococcus mutans 15VF2]|uniref:MBL fold metallo-hydrolase n=1 Tax=Streptococcus mutans TaxID=1309 RepID=UPI0002B58CC6|nr:MBL fold metallo-hydrolase [Streptococcus mutans]EMB73063.1 beta-lactamase domain-containing protein [Streptococcus mutans 15VF2]
MTDTNIKMFRMVHGKYINYTYILSDKENKSVIIDPSWNLKKILRYLEEKSLQLESILLTHSHIDHTNLVEQLVNLFDVDVYISKVEVDYYHCDYPNLQVINDGELLLFGNLKVKCILSPGHTKGSTSYRTFVQITYLLVIQYLLKDVVIVKEMEVLLLICTIQLKKSKD